MKSNLLLIKLFLNNNKYNKIFEWTEPQAGCIGYMKFNGIPGREDMNLIQFADELISKYGILILPGNLFPTTNTTTNTFATTKTVTATATATATANQLDSAPLAEFHRFFRFGFGRRNFPECLKQLELAIDNMVASSKC